MELSRLFVCLGGLAKFFSVCGTEKIAGLWFWGRRKGTGWGGHCLGGWGGGVSTQADAMVNLSKKPHFLKNVSRFETRYL